MNENGRGKWNIKKNCFKNSAWNNIKTYESKQVNEEGITRNKDENRDEKILLTLGHVLNFLCVEMCLN